MFVIQIIIHIDCWRYDLFLKHLDVAKVTSVKATHHLCHLPMRLVYLILLLHAHIDTRGAHGQILVTFAIIIDLASRWMHWHLLLIIMTIPTDSMSVPLASTQLSRSLTHFSTFLLTFKCCFRATNLLRMLFFLSFFFPLFHFFIIEVVTRLLPMNTNKFW